MSEVPWEEGGSGGAALEALLLYMQGAWPEEACGALFVSALGEWLWRPLENVAGNKLQAFVVGEGWLRLLQEEERRGGRLVCLAHSHPEGEAELSRADIRSLAPGGKLLWPGLMQMVVATGEGGWREAAWFSPPGVRGEAGLPGFVCGGRLSRACFEARKRRTFAL
ncbi:MAG: Mov34/MPN/PAD-1 family protein [Cystobacterineae bacterium]|nr:Mov34/MPN/PAD-1 family protein [Cystobacterineae bacterium]